MGDYSDDLRKYHEDNDFFDAFMFVHTPGRLSKRHPFEQTIPKETNVNKTQIEREMDALRRQLTRLEEQLDKQSDFEVLRDLEEKTVISFEYAFHAGGILYSYAAIKAEGLWYATGPRSPKGYGNDEFISWLANAYEVRDLRVRGKGRSIR